MKEILLCKLNDVVSYLSSCDLDNFADVRELSIKILEVQTKVYSRAFDLYISNLDIKKEIEKELKALCIPADHEIRG